MKRFSTGKAAVLHLVKAIRTNQQQTSRKGMPTRYLGKARILLE